jgi:hypothetical protein
MPVGDWLYMVFMHHACIFETKEQYKKAHEIITNVMKDFFLNGTITEKLKDAVEAFQLKLYQKQQYIAYYVRKKIHNCYDAMTTSPVESINSHIKHRSKATTLNNMSRSLMNITQATDSRISTINNASKRELQLTVIQSRFKQKELYHRKCVYLLNHNFDNRQKQCCVMHAKSEWIVWNVEYDPPKFKGDKLLGLSERFPVFANVYNVNVMQMGNQSFLKCDCLLYERCGIPCTHILKVTDSIEDIMIKVQHRKVYEVHFGDDDSELSHKLMAATTLQVSNEDMGVPISHECLVKTTNPMFVSLNQDIHDCSYDPQQYPLYYEGTTMFDYQMATMVLSRPVVTMQEMRHLYAKEYSNDQVPHSLNMDSSPYDSVW